MKHNIIAHNEEQRRRRNGNCIYKLLQWIKCERTSSYVAHVRQRMLLCGKIIHRVRARRQAVHRIAQPHSERGQTRLQGCKVSQHSHTIPHYPACPIKVWDWFMSQIEATLNIMRTSRIFSTNSAYEALNGQIFDWNKPPLAPLGQRALSLLNLYNHLSWPL